MNPMTAWLGAAADLVKGERKALGPDSPLRRLEQMNSEVIKASLDLFRDVRDAVSEATFFHVYGNMFSLYLADQHTSRALAGPMDPRELPAVKEALAAIGRGGYAEAVARMGALLAADDQFLPLSAIELKRDLMAEYADYLPDLPPDTRRRVRGEQDIIVRYAREQAVATLPELLADPDDRARFLEFMDRLRDDPRLIGHAISDHDVAVIAAVRQALGAPARGGAVRGATVRRAPARRAAAKLVPTKGKTQQPAAAGRSVARRKPAGRKPQA